MKLGEKKVKGWICDWCPKVLVTFKFKFDGGVRRIYFLQPTMTVLVTGGTGQTGLILCRLLNEANISLLSCSRSGTAPRPYKAVKFDWFDEKTFKSPFRADPKIDRVYLIVPSVMGQLSTVKSFIDLAISKVTNRNWIPSTDGEGPRVPVEH